jgi:pimeloyl-ACP methyl ester carboxylesterase
MRSSIQFWARSPWDPIRELSGDHRVVAMDQRNAGASCGPVLPDDGWHTYADDQLRLLDHLGIERANVLGGCIGGAFALKLAERAPDRITAAVLQQPIGLKDNRDVFHQLFDDWAAELGPARPDLQAAALSSFKANLYGGDFVFSVSRAFVETCKTPLLVLRGNDVYHPSAISEEIVRLAPHATLIERWREGEATARATTEVRTFLARHAPR